MISERELERRLELARQDRSLEPAFFRCLLDAVVYAHAPVSDDHPRLRLIQFQHPDGFYALPFFTSQAKALFAAGSTARLVKLTGRDLFEGTPGATFMLNPNDGGCVLYPEEIDALLTTGAVARIEKFQLEEDSPFIVSEQVHPPTWLMPLLMAVYAQLSVVETAYLLEVALPKDPTQRTLLVTLAVAPEHAERAARATITAAQPLCAQEQLALDVTTFNPAKGKPAYLSHPGVERFYGSDIGGHAS